MRVKVLEYEHTEGGYDDYPYGDGTSRVEYPPSYSGVIQLYPDLQPGEEISEDELLTVALREISGLTGESLWDVTGWDIKAIGETTFAFHSQ